jgi:uncharacterized membrane protein
MAFCPSCGTSVSGNFCPKCGASMTGGASAAAPPPPPPPTAPLNVAGIPTNIASLLCYIIPVVCPIIFLVVDPYRRDRKIRFDAFQSIFLTVVFIAISILIDIILGGSYALYQLARLVRLAEFVLIVFMAFKAYQNDKVVLPIIGPLAEKQA